MSGTISGTHFTDLKKKNNKLKPKEISDLS